MIDNRDVKRETLAHRLVTVLRRILTWPGRIGRAGVTLGAWYGAVHIVRKALEVQPIDKTVLGIGIALFLFGVAFAWPDFIVRAFAALANGYDAVKSRRGAP